MVSRHAAGAHLGEFGTNDRSVQSAGRRLCSRDDLAAELGPDYIREFQRDLHALAEKYRAKLIPFLLGDIVTKDMKYFQADGNSSDHAGCGDRCRNVQKAVQNSLSRQEFAERYAGGRPSAATADSASIRVSERHITLPAFGARTSARINISTLLLSIYSGGAANSNLVGQEVVPESDRSQYRQERSFVLSGHNYYFRSRTFSATSSQGLRIPGIAARRSAGFLANGLLAAEGVIVVQHYARAGWPNQAAFATVFFKIPRLVFAILIAYWVAGVRHSYTMAR